MQKLRKQIKESFFNPVLHLLPLLVFLVVEDFLGMTMGWKISFPIALGLLIYVYFVYNRIFTWHLIFTAFYLLVTIIAWFETLFPIKIIKKDILYEVVVLLGLFLFIVFRKQIQKTISGIISNMIPMTNNFNELFRVIWALFIVLVVYVSSFIVVDALIKYDTPFLLLLQYLYVGVLLFLATYEVMRVHLIRAKLLKEEWWPIVSNQGKIIGSIQHLTSLNDEKNYMHPVVHVLLIDKSMILLKKREFNDPESPDLWDSSISNHVKMGETIEKCVERSADEKYGINNFRFMYLSNYSVNGKNEKQYAFLFVSCLQAEYKLNPVTNEQTKWWTQRQIEDNMKDGIFSENFKMEFDLLQRSGLLETGKCECNCKMRDVIYQQTSATEKASLN
jgi:isopentenyldiphosphate isomerase